MVELGLVPALFNFDLITFVPYFFPVSTNSARVYSVKILEEGGTFRRQPRGDCVPEICRVGRVKDLKAER